MKRGDLSREQIITAGLKMAGAHGLDAVTGRRVANALNRAHTGVRYYFEAPNSLRQAVISAAIERDDVMVIARLILDQHDAVAHLSREDRTRYLSLADLDRA
jgi:DNA-binding transcriptional regulator YbjK